jgi:predicted amidohydrolase YtcJ
VQPQLDAADTIYTDGDVVTVNDKQPSAEAVAIKGGKIVAVGTRAEVEKTHKGGNTVVVSLGGKALLPGFLDAHIANRGREQAMYISPMRDAIDKGLAPTNHTDFVVAPLDQMFMMWSAVNRLSRGGEVIGADQRVTPLEALKAMTINVAQQYGEQASKGSLEVGKLADLVVLDQNPLKVDPMKIKDVRVVETIKEGKTIYKRNP